mmetsp:Transcript_29587/g.64319  ORF Transcript_29587/g.64319 Transcript_29587/m.64319 type:complete len:397 (-) Transcript_29587:163-1353(-)|eukprot:CAMPEP_0170616606 /NCGR_PEP_ID=MMETSP0224-20130122/25958_1 /TAXON_ID=285029 /ORGANISM="Togula jolla, Strain CCCM 725" /LENGTH=396 /DNA_ID=CAMNT_0010942411 /DNA_START=42 /DNA_END=1232 /DNA_ORIENTATION=+
MMQAAGQAMPARAALEVSTAASLRHRGSAALAVTPAASQAIVLRRGSGALPSSHAVPDAVFTAGLTGCKFMLAGAVIKSLRRRGVGHRTVARRAEAMDSVTGTKFEEEDEEKNPQRRPGHQVKGMQEVDPETAARQARVREHQEGCKRLSWAEEIRTIVAQPKGFATFSTMSRKESTKDYPVGSMVGFAADEQGRPIFCFSGMSSHTGNVLADSRASLCVTESDFRGAADARVVLTGDVKAVPKEDQEAVRKLYLEKHPGAYWVNFGDFTMFRMDTILDVAFVGGFARAGGVTPEEYAAAQPDPCLAFAEPVMKHMNDDHGESLKSYVEYLIGAGPCDAASIKRFDRYGLDLRVRQGEGEGILRVCFAEPVTERKDIKNAIMDLSKQVAEIKEKAK